MASEVSWIRSRAMMWATAIVIPPVGLVLLWLRPRTRILVKLLGSLGIVVITLAHLVVVWELRVEIGGTGELFFYFGTPESSYARVERQRARQRLEAPPVGVAETAAQGAFWPRLLGPRGDGHLGDLDLASHWPADGLPLLWKQPIGGGYASFAVANGMAFTIEQRHEQEVVAAYDLRSGREIWTHSWPAVFREPMGGEGPRATPSWDEGRLYALGATGELHVLKANTGELLWRRNILTDAEASNLTWGMAASPLIVDDKVIVLPGGRNGRSVAAYDKLTGEPIWFVHDDVQAYTTPILTTLAGQRQLLVVGGARAMGLMVEDGALLWDYPWVTQYGANAAQPLVVDDRHFFISAGYDHGAALVEITREGDRFAAREVWSNNRMKNLFSTSILHRGHVYGLDAGILTCLDVATGERLWKGERYGHGELLLAGEHLIVLTEKGRLALVEATPERFVEVASFAALRGKTWNHPAFADGVLLVRNARQMAAFAVGDLKSLSSTR